MAQCTEDADGELLGSTLEAINRGGEVHTFTRVEFFGGGVVPILNDLAGTPIPAPECLAAPPAEYIGPGGVDADHIDAHGTLYYQCCIHPWIADHGDREVTGRA